MNIITTTKGDFTISTDKSKLDLEVIHDYLANQSYWSKNIPKERIRKSIANALCFGIYYKDKQIGYAKVVSDFSTMAYLGDVFVLEDYRGQGLSKWLMETIMSHPELTGLRRWILLTSDAHELYKKFGWQPIASPEKWMEIHRPDIFRES
ncbi:MULTISPECIES: GNAT family N-acetyltransferase [unclassified Flavobacterium]|uniref:GNAT family N-acetyltransferase n=1 Tax=unclassified Flavobacterium TaxID=196869 RepID=UPI000964EF55|nr:MULTISPECIES: GNAT family N-acetyltransferase [unclassified Flavobacterium]MBN9282993.1 GNAT family N-acetyltransferase [Flavobacterium sp.]OJV67628.1 MAG: GNAT family N-acetyltransferase [Flavobacterium sp. 40-81]